jgi:hypothetical protein
MPDSPRTKQYPTLPDSLTASTAKGFATAFERAYQFNSKLPAYESIQIDLSVPDWSVSEVQQGYAVGLEGRVQFDNAKTATGTSTARPSGFFEFSLWDFLTDSFAVRGQPSYDKLQKEDTPQLANAVTIACDDPDE